MKHALKDANKLVKDSQLFDAKGEVDTLRLWENYRDQAMLWRALALLQIPATLVLALFAYSVWSNRNITLNVPAKPLPGLYAAQDIPDSEFLNVSTNLINLIATYQPAVARRQFQKAREHLREPMLATFDREMMNIELKAIETTNRSQIFFIDPTKTKLERQGNEIIASLTGDRMKLVAGKQLPEVTTRFIVTMTTIPRNDLNPYGIVVSNITFENVTE